MKDDSPTGSSEPLESKLESKPKKRPKAIGIVSGGLDSTLAIEVLKEQDVEVHAINFYTGFCTAELNRRVGGRHTEKEVATNAALQAGAYTETEIEMIDISDEYVKMVLQPVHGYGKNMNPCIDCRIMMLRKAAEIMKTEEADFVFTGEVLGQRPMSQHKQALEMIETEAGLEGKLLRPLTAGFMKTTEAEKAGLVQRDQLPHISGRSRKQQIAMAKKYGIEQYPTPSGGCCQLTDANFSRKFRDFLEEKLRDADGRIEEVHIDPDDTILLGVGRHFRLGPSVRLIVGRDEDENNLLESYAQRMPDAFTHLKAEDFVGPTSLLTGRPDEDQVRTAAGATARYSDGRSEASLRIQACPAGADPPASADPIKPYTLEVAPLSDQALERLRI